MSNPELGEFSIRCDAQGIAFDTRFLRDGIKIPDAQEMIPDKWSEAVVAAAYCLQIDPERNLVSVPVPESLLGDDPTAAQISLIGILNASARKNAVIPPIVNFPSAGFQDAYACRRSEARFVETWRAMSDPVNVHVDGLGKKIGWTIVASKGIPIAVEKYNGSRLVLGLEPFSVGGIPFPAGSLYRSEEPLVEHNPLIKSGSQGRKSQVDADSIESLCFKRLSPFATPPLRRSREYPQLGKNQEPEIRTWSLSIMRNIAQRALEFSS